MLPILAHLIGKFQRRIKFYNYFLVGLGPRLMKNLVSIVRMWLHQMSDVKTLDVLISEVKCTGSAQKQFQCL